MEPPGNSPDSDVIAALERAGIAAAARATDRLAFAHDASHYRLVPTAVVSPNSRDQIAALFPIARKAEVSVTFRSGGTSLSGQASSAGLLIDTRRHFRDIEVLEAGALVRTGPGATVRAVNTRLARHGRKLGPDPASEIACTIGGVVANNSSGMACGIRANTYQTLQSAVLVLPSGTIIDTSDPGADDELEATEPDLYRGLEQLRDRVRGDSDSVERIHALYAIKNTMGYGVNSFLDFERPVDILLHLAIGSEGTLAFVAEAVFATLPILDQVATGLLLFPSLAAAATALPALVESGFATIELLDATSLRVAQKDVEAPDELLGLDVVDHAALLVEYQEPTADALASRIGAAEKLLSGFQLAQPAILTSEPTTRARLWRVRKGLYTLVAGNRPAGTTALLEDIAVPVERLSETCAEIQKLFSIYGYSDAVIFGHAKDGNIHFMLTENFDLPESVARYEAFTESMVTVVLSQGGTLKAEHGTGRIMAPYVRRQYGDELYAVMLRVKSLIDPDGLLNPGVLLTDDPHAHIRNLKTVPPVEGEVDRCVECGYCEPACPSRDLTLTPRQRIVLRREMAHAEATDNRELLTELQEQYRYDGVETCAVDGMCQSACPVLINTGDLVRRLRSETGGRVREQSWDSVARNWDTVSALGSAALTTAKTMPPIVARIATTAGRALLGTDTVPSYTSDLPRGGRRRARLSPPDPVAVYFSSCTNTMFGPVGDSSVESSFLALCERAGVVVSTPADIPSLCCGTPWKSKGLSDGYATMKQRVTASLMRVTDAGRLPVVCDASSCTEGLRTLLEASREAGIRVEDAVAFVDREILPRLPETGRKVASLTLHPTCSSVHLGLGAALERVAAAAADTVVIPDEWSCCGFAGDRGMLHPELTAAATAREAAEARAASTDSYASVNRTCELGMTRATGREYEHILQLLDRATAKPTDTEEPRK